MIERKTVLEQPELNRSGTLQVKVALLLVEDGRELQCNWHRVSVGLTDAASEVLDDLDKSLVTMNPPWPTLGQADREFVADCHALQQRRFDLRASE